MSLKTRFLALTALIILVASLTAAVAFERVAEDLVAEWGKRLTEIQVRYDSARVLQPLERDLALSRQLADSEVIAQWARSPDDPTLREAGLAELERFRNNFRDHNYFAAFRSDGAYYYNNAENEFAGRQLRYHLDPEDPDDAWFYKLIEQGRTFHLNVNPDTELGVTKLWIDVLVRDGDEILGIVGTGLTLDAFLRDIVDLDQPGITTMFVDRNQAIQLYRDENMIEYASFIKPEGQKNTIDRLLDTEADRARVARMMENLARGAGDGQRARVVTDFVSVGGTRQLAGIAYLPSVGWYEVTLVDMAQVMPVSRFWRMALVFGTTLLFSLLLFHFAVNRLILRPVRALEGGMSDFARGGTPDPATLPAGQDELGALSRHFLKMVDAIREHTASLEEKIARRTEALNRLARIDPLTELANRRGMEEHLEQVIRRAEREGSNYAVLWIDIDRFKWINDAEGHQAGDEALQAVARVLEDCIRGYDMAARWGGDEFLVVMSPCSAEDLETVAQRICRDVQQLAPGILGVGQVTVSIGAAVGRPGEAPDAVLHRADQALYKVKTGGRDGYRVARPPTGDAPA
ncbi:MAG: diguanylate cyclase domain-containing protein [Halothiobacillaceae bacterium]